MDKDHRLEKIMLFRVDNVDETQLAHHDGLSVIPMPAAACLLLTPHLGTKHPYLRILLLSYFLL